MRCDACERENPAGSRFCNQCGAALAGPCAECGCSNPPDARFCNGCGAPLAEPRREPSAATQPGAASPTAETRPGADPRAYTPAHLAERILRTRSAMEGERKHVTVLFCDLVGSTPLAERLGPEAMHALLDRCFQEILARVHGAEGTVNQFLGDGVMALFGAPLALEDAPRRAVRAALEIQRALAAVGAEVHERHALDVRWRIGIHSGPVVVGRIGDDLRMDYTAVGDTTNLAARLQGLAAPGSVLISEATQHLVEGWFEVRDLGPLEVRGKAQPVRGFEVRGERPVRDRIDVAAERGLTPLVGRSRELDTLRDAFEQARAGHGRVVFVVGEAGLGKSRLLHEFRRSLEDAPHRWVEGHCASYARDSAFHAIADAVRRGFEIDERDDDAAALAKLERRERQLGGELAWTLPFVRGLLSLPTGDAAADALDAATRRAETFRAVRERMLRAAEREVFVLVIEDLHWVDRASEEFLAYLLDSIPAARVLAVLTHRPGRRPAIGDRSYHVQLMLQPLSERDMARMTGTLLEAKELPEGLRALIAAKAEGNPFFVEEVVRSLVEEGALKLEAGRVRLTRRLDEIRIPDSIQDVLMARLDRLEEGPKRALQVASVIGREFAMRLLERIHEAGAGLEPVVAELRALELIYEKSLHPELAFMFKHALTHDVAYGSVLEGRRKALHRIVGTAIEELYRDRLAEHFEALAHHFDEGDELEKALFYHERAAEKATGAYANQAAREHGLRALALADRLGPRVGDDVRFRLLVALGASEFAMSEFPSATAHLERAIELAPGPAETAAVRAGCAMTALWGHDYAGLHRHTEAALAAPAGTRADAGRTYAVVVRAYEAAVCAEHERFEQLLRESEPLSHSLPDARALWLQLEGHRFEWSARWKQALRTHTEGIECARKHRLALYLIAHTWSRAKALICLGRFGEALDSLEEAHSLCERIGDRAWKVRILNTLGWAWEDLGDAERAADYNLRSVALANEMLELELVAGVPELLGNASANLARNRIALGDLGAASAALAPAEQDLARPGDPWMRWRYALHVQHSAGCLALARGDADAALAAAEAELAGSRTHRSPKLEARALLLRAQALLASERVEAAVEATGQARALAERIGHASLGWRALALSGALARRRGDRAAGEAACKQLHDALEAVRSGTRRADASHALRACAEALMAEAAGGSA